PSDKSSNETHADLPPLDYNAPGRESAYVPHNILTLFRSLTLYRKSRLPEVWTKIGTWGIYEFIDPTLAQYGRRAVLCRRAGPLRARGQLYATRVRGHHRARLRGRG